MKITEELNSPENSSREKYRRITPAIFNPTSKKIYDFLEDDLPHDYRVNKDESYSEYNRYTNDIKILESKDNGMNTLNEYYNPTFDNSKNN